MATLDQDFSSDELLDASHEGDWLLAFYRQPTRHLPVETPGWDPNKPDELLQQLVAAQAEAAVCSWIDR